MKKFFYRVGENDSVLKICQNFNVPISILISLNNLTCEVESGDLLYIEIPNGTFYMVGVLDTLESIAKKFSISKEEILSKNHIDYIYFGMVILV